MTMYQDEQKTADKKSRGPKRWQKSDIKRLEKLVDASYRRSRITSVILIAILIVALLVYFVWDFPSG